MESWCSESCYFLRDNLVEYLFWSSLSVSFLQLWQNTSGKQLKGGKIYFNSLFQRFQSMVSYVPVLMLGVSLTSHSQGWGPEWSSWLKSPENRRRAWEQRQQDMGPDSTPLNVSPGYGPTCKRGIRTVKVWQSTSWRGDKGGKKWVKTL
jgi:hypothetical protein